MAKNTTWKDVENDLIKYKNTVLAAAAGRIRDELTKEAEIAIETFYNDYSPISYNRHFYNFQNYSFKKYYSNPHNKIFRGSVELTPQLMKDIYEDDVTEVFDTVYAGFHGVASMFYSPESFLVIPKRMFPSPIELLYKKREEIIKNIDSYIDIGKQSATKTSYSTIKMR